MSTWAKIQKIIGNVYDYDRENIEKISKILEAIAYSNGPEELLARLRNI